MKQRTIQICDSATDGGLEGCISITKALAIPLFTDPGGSRFKDQSSTSTPPPEAPLRREWLMINASRRCGPLSVILADTPGGGPEPKTIQSLRKTSQSDDRGGGGSDSPSATQQWYAHPPPKGVLPIKKTSIMHVVQLERAKLKKGLSWLERRVKKQKPQEGRRLSIMLLWSWCKKKGTNGVHFPLSEGK